MISIITPFYKSEKYLGDAIQSVLNQSYSDWEIILINDGSPDNSKEIALSCNDSRIRYFEQKNKGVSAARNLGLANMKGNFFCFLDADDVLPKQSLESRLEIFKSAPNIIFVDGVVHKKDSLLKTTFDEWYPNFSGNPLKDLVSLTGSSFLGLTWMIKRIPNKKYCFYENLSHCEDLFFYMQLAREGGDYAFTTEPILHYRDSPNSAMKNLKGLEKGYRFVEYQINQWPEITNDLLKSYKYKYKRAMCLAYLRGFQPFNAIKALF